jgi:hypothetical protein
MTFWNRFLQVNAQLLAEWLRKAADELDIIAPGAARVAAPVLFFGKGGISMGAITVKDTDAPFGATVTFLDAKGAPTSPNDVPQWSSDNDAAASVVAAADGLSAEVSPGTPGAAVITVSTTDADGTVVTSQGTVTVQSGAAVIGDVEFTAPAAPAPAPGP